MAPPAAIVLCPLRFERRVLQRSGLAGRVALACCGPGAAAIDRWAPPAPPHVPVILCGLAASVDPSLAVGGAHAAAFVVVHDGRRLEPSIPAPTGTGAVLGSAPGLLATPQAKRAWAARSRAQLADMESATFARRAAAGGWLWTIVRGVSDGPDDALPPDLDRWIDQRGRTRLAAVAGSIVSGRAGARRLARLRAGSVRAMEAAALLLERILDGLTCDPVHG